jgi:hypothetical protein
VNDNVALFNEFVKETGVDNYTVFNRINGSDVESMDPMDALVTAHVLKHPTLAGQEAAIRKNFERKYNVDPEQVEEDELALNKISLISDGDTAKAELKDLKGKLKIPEPTDEPPVKPQELTPEQKTALQTGWKQITSEVGKTLGSIEIPMKGLKDPVLSYQLGDDLKNKVIQDAVEYCVNSKKEFNEANVKSIANMMYNRLIIDELPNIAHSIFEKARSLTKEEVTALYDNPNPARNTDQPPVPPGTKTEAEKTADDVFEAEMGRGGL